MVLNTTTLPRGQLLKGSIPLAHIARVMCWVNIILSVGALWLAWAWLQGYLVVKGKTFRSSTLGFGVNGLVANVTGKPIAFKNTFVVYLVNYGSQFTRFTAQIGISPLFRIGFAPRMAISPIRFLISQIMSSPVLFVLAMLYAVSFSELWCVFNGALLYSLANLTLRLVRFTSRQGIFEVKMKFTQWFLLLAFRTKPVTWPWNWFNLGMKFSLTSLKLSALSAISASSIQTLLRQFKILKGFFDTAFRADSGEDKQGKLNNVLLNSVIELCHSYMPPNRCCSLEATCVGIACSLASFASIIPQVGMEG